MSLSQIVTYDVAANFAFNSALVQVPNGGPASLKKSQAPAGATFYAPFDTSLDALYAAGVGSATNSGGLLTTGSGGKFGEALDLRGGTIKYVRYAAAANADSAQVGAFNFFYIPAYGGVTSAIRQLFAQCKDLVGGLPNLNECYHDLSTMHLTWRMFNSAGVNIFTADLGAWTPVANTAYEFEFNWDLTTGASRLFINGAQFGATQNATGTRSSANIGYLFIGTDRSASTATDARFDDFTVYSAVQHTANYTSRTTDNGRYSVANPTVQVNTGVEMNALVGFTETSVKTGSDQIKWYLLVDGVAKWWNGTAWALSDGSYAQSSLASDINANVALLVLPGNNVIPVATLHSNDGTTTPSLTSVKVDYNAFEVEPTKPNTCFVYTWIENILGIKDTSATAKLNAYLQAPFLNSQHLVAPVMKSVNFDANGYAEIELVESATPNKKYLFTLTYVDGGVTKTAFLGAGIVPNQGTAALSSIVTL